MIFGTKERLEVGNSKKHRVGGWKPDLTGFGEFMAYGLFRNSAAVSAKSRVNSTSIVLVKEWLNCIENTGNEPGVNRKLNNQKRMTLTMLFHLMSSANSNIHGVLDVRKESLYESNLNGIGSA